MCVCKAVTNVAGWEAKSEMRSSQGSSERAHSSSQDQWEATEIVSVGSDLIICELQRSHSGFMKRIKKRARRKNDGRQK